MSEAAHTRIVLLVEDSVLVAFAVEEALTERGFDVIVAGSLGAVEERLGALRPFVALLDLHLPDGNSLDLATRLHAMGCKVALCTGMDAQAMPTGFEFARHFRKPVAAEDLVRWVMDHAGDGHP